MISYFYTNYQIKHRKEENNENEKMVYLKGKISFNYNFANKTF